MARDYAKVSPRFWTGHTGRKVRAAGAEAQLVALYLLSSPQANMIGLYYQPIPTLSHETGLSPEGASKALRRLGELDFAYYDEAEEVIWVPEMARHQIAEHLKPNDNQIKAVEKEVEKYRKSRFYAAFVEKYGAAFHLTNLPPSEALPSPSTGSSKGLRSQEQEQEQDQKQDQDPLAGQPSAPQPVGGTPKAKTRKTKAAPAADPRHILFVETADKIYIEARGEKPSFDGSDGKALKGFLQSRPDVTLEEWSSRWRRSVLAPFHRCARVRELVSKWGHHAQDVAPVPVADDFSDATQYKPVSLLRGGQ